MPELLQDAGVPTLAANECMRNPRRIRGHILLAVGMVVFDFILALKLTTASNVIGRPPGALDGAVFFLVFAAPCVWFAWRISKAGLWIGPDAVVIRGPLRTWRIQPSEAVRFVPGVQRGAGNGTPCPILERAGGSGVGVWALGREGWIWSFEDYLNELEPLCDQLNRLLEQSRAGVGTLVAHA